MIILGIDPGLAIIGYGLVEYKNNKFRTIDYGAITTPAGMSTVNQLFHMYDIDEVGIEELFFNKNVKTAITVAQARGVILLSCQHHAKPTYEYTPLQVKQGVCGYGRADKSQVQKMVTSFLSLKEIPKPDDVADALAVAICHAHSNRMGKELSRF